MEKSMINEKIPVIAVLGPTATGKTALSIRIAQEMNGEVISADSMQVYRGMDIGTAKPGREERKGIAHHLIDVVDPTTKFDLSEYVKCAHIAASDINSRNKIPVVTGGTGLYIDTFLRNISCDKMDTDPQIRQDLIQRANERGGRNLLDSLYEMDRETAQRLHENDIKRIVRALEVCISTNKPYSAWIKESSRYDSPYNICYIGLMYLDRTRLYDRIDLRVDQMIKDGLVNEAKELFEAGLDKRHTAMQAIGYKELFLYFKGEVSLLDAVTSIKRESRRYAKRQMTWFGKNKDIRWIQVDTCRSTGDVYEKALEIIRSHTIIHQI